MLTLLFLSLKPYLPCHVPAEPQRNRPVRGRSRTGMLHPLRSSSLSGSPEQVPGSFLSIRQRLHQSLPGARQKVPVAERSQQLKLIPTACHVVPVRHDTLSAGWSEKKQDAGQADPESAGCVGHHLPPWSNCSVDPPFTIEKAPPDVVPGIFNLCL